MQLTLQEQAYLHLRRRKLTKTETGKIISEIRKLHGKNGSESHFANQYEAKEIGNIPYYIALLDFLGFEVILKK